MDIADWITERRDGAVSALRQAVSAVTLLHGRPGFGWQVRPARGSILASPVSAHWDPEPDYFHHWIRDAAVALKVWPDVIACTGPDDADWWRQAFHDHVTFSLAISDPDRAGPARNPLHETTDPDHLRFLRPDAELAALGGSAWLEEPRVAADGGPDLEQWSRPQDDGPALRASALMEVMTRCPELRTETAERLLRRDLSHLSRVAGRPSIGPWEEEPARHCSFTLLAAWDALDRGSRELPDLAASLGAAAKRVADILRRCEFDGGWAESAGARHFDSATVLALLQVGRSDGPFALTAPRARRTVEHLERLFSTLYPINAGRDVPAIGRWAEDVFFDGNPWFPVTLGFAEYHYRRAALTGHRDDIRRGDGYMALVREVAPPGDALPEQFHRATGSPVSCRALTWSAAAFLSAAAARQTAAER